MKVALDASSLLSGGAQNHLRSILRDWKGAPDLACLIFAHPDLREVLAEFESPGVSVVEIADAQDTLRRLVWQQVHLPREACAAGCEVIFCPGGLAPFRSDVPTVVMFRNMLPFTPAEVRRYSALRSRLRLYALRWLNEASWRWADGVIALNEPARRIVLRAAPAALTRTIPHGVTVGEDPAAGSSFAGPYTEARPMRLVYVSSVNPYKRHDELIRAVKMLLDDGIHVSLQLVGPPSDPATATRLKEVTRGLKSIRIDGTVDHEGVLRILQDSDAFVFPSSCENQPNALLEAMGAGLPVAASAWPPMPETARDAAIYFDPSRPSDIARAIRRLYGDEALCRRLGSAGRERASAFNWHSTAMATKDFLKFVADNSAERR